MKKSEIKMELIKSISAVRKGGRYDISTRLNAIAFISGVTTDCDDEVFNLICDTLIDLRENLYHENIENAVFETINNMDKAYKDYKRDFKLLNDAFMKFKEARYFV